MIQPLFAFSEFGLMILRIAVGAILIVHSWPKIRNFKKTAAKAIFYSILEFGGGILLIIGFLVQPVAMLTAVRSLITIFKFKMKKKIAGGYEMDLLLLASSLVLTFSGSGAYSLESFLDFWLY